MDRDGPGGKENIATHAKAIQERSARQKKSLPDHPEGGQFPREYNPHFFCRQKPLIPEMKKPGRMSMLSGAPKLSGEGGSARNGTAVRKK